MYNFLNINKMKYISLIFIIILGWFNLKSQTSELLTFKNWELIGYGKSAERINDKYLAINYYSEYYRRNKNNNKLAYKLANLYFDVKDYKNAKYIFYELYKKRNKKYSKSLYKYAQILKTEEKYDSAIICFEIYRDEFLLNKKKDIRNFYLLMIKNEIEGCELALQQKRNQKNIKILHLNKTINKVHKESSPFLINDTTLIYSSLMIDTLPIVEIDQKQNIPVNKFYQASYEGKVWLGGQDPPKPFFNYDNLNTSDGVFSDDLKRFYFTVSKETKSGKKISELYLSKYINGQWQNPEKMDARINLKNYISSQPTMGKCYNKNYDVIYFISDRPNGYGGTDIWYTIYDKQTQKYKKPVNAGSYINTPANEITPYYQNSTKTMFFSSDGLQGYGGYDIYKTTGELVNWLPCENIGKPINSSYDDIYYLNIEDKKKGFFVSNRNESEDVNNPNCCYDIFQYEINKIDKALKLSGKIYEAEKIYANILQKNKKGTFKKIKHTKSKPSSNTKVELHIENKNNAEFILLKIDTTNNNGTFNFNVDKNQNYVLKITKEDFAPTKIKFNTYNKKNKLFVINPVTIIPVQHNTITLNNIYFEFNKYELTQKSKKYIDTSLLVFMKKNKNIVIEINAHTDGVGSEEYNLELSVKRAESVEKYLIKSGINKDRIIAKGYGEAKPIATEFKETGEDNPEGREKNRRIEFKIVGLLIDE